MSLRMPKVWQPDQSKAWVWLLSCFGVFALFVMALSVGRISVDPSLILSWLAGGKAAKGSEAATAYVVLENLRLPRAGLALILGAGLGVSGAVLQCVLRNPLGGPQNVGLLAGAGAGGTLALLLAFSSWGVVLFALLGGLVALACVLWLARVQGQITVLSLVLSGVVISSLFTALIALLQYVADPERQLPNLVFWLMGSLSSANANKMALAGICVLPSLALLWAISARLDVLASGDSEAKSLGVKPALLRSLALISSALICSAVVACAGLIAWIGLVVPHMARMLVGSQMRSLIPASALMGAGVLLVVDTLCRSATGAEIPLGAITAILGAPLFAWLLKKQFRLGAL
jgi:iron complex transport system permease protein